MYGYVPVHVVLFCDSPQLFETVAIIQMNQASS